MQIKRFDHSEYRTFARPITGVLGLALLGLALMSLGLIAALVAPQESVAQSNNPDAMPLGVFASGADHVLINGTRALPGTEIFAGDEGAMRGVVRGVVCGIYHRHRPTQPCSP